MSATKNVPLFSVNIYKWSLRLETSYAESKRTQQLSTYFKAL